MNLTDLLESYKKHVIDEFLNQQKHTQDDINTNEK